MFDNCSQGTIVTKDIVKELGITGTLASVTINTLNGDLTKQSLAVERFKVKVAAGSEDSKWVKLPKTFSCVELPVDTDDVATPEEISKRKYLGKIANEINQTSDTGFELSRSQSRIAIQFLFFAAQVNPSLLIKIAIHFKTSSFKFLHERYSCFLIVL